MKLEAVKDKNGNVIFEECNISIRVKNNNQMASIQAERLIEHIKNFWYFSESPSVALFLGSMMVGFAESCSMSDYIDLKTLDNVMELMKRVINHYCPDKE